MTVGRYIPTEDGQGVATIYGKGADETFGDVMPIATAEHYLTTLRRDAWNRAAEHLKDRRRESYVADLYLEWANSLSDALTYAEELRGEGEKKERVAA